MLLNDVSHQQEGDDVVSYPGHCQFVPVGDVLHLRLCDWIFRDQNGQTPNGQNETVRCSLKSGFGLLPTREDTNGCSVSSSVLEFTKQSHPTTISITH